MEAILKYSEQAYRMMFEGNPLPMMVFDHETLEILEVNDAAVEHYGYSREEFLSMTIKDIRPPEEVPKLLDVVSIITEGIDKPGSFKHLKKDVLKGKKVSLDLEEILIALGISATTNPMAQIVIEKLKELNGCEVHTSHIPTPGDAAGLRKLGVNATSDPKFPTSDLYID